MKMWIAKAFIQMVQIYYHANHRICFDYYDKYDGFHEGKDDFVVPYRKPLYNGKHCTQWL